jgi:hypothetical protein
MANIVAPYRDDDIYVSVTAVNLSHGSAVAQFASVIGQWGTPTENSTGTATATFVSRTDSNDSFSFRWTLTSNNGASRTVGTPTVLNLTAVDNIGSYYLQSFYWSTQGQFGRYFSESTTYTAAQNAGSVTLYPNSTYQGIYQYDVESATEGATARFMIVDPTATAGDIRNYTITGIDGSDLTTPLSGTLTFSGVNAYLNVTPSIDNAADSETLYLNIEGFAPRAININNVAALIPQAPSFESDLDGYQELINNGNVVFIIPTLATGMSWSYSVDQGTNWIEGGLTAGRHVVSLPDGYYAANSILVRTVDSNGIAAISVPNGSQRAHTVDQTNPSSLFINIAEDTGLASDSITHNGQINLTGIESQARWFYSLDNVNWIQGVGSSIDLMGDGAKTLRVKQIDLAGNTSAISSIALTLDSAIETLSLNLQEDTGENTDGITSSGRIDITGIETGADWFYSLDTVTWLQGTGTYLDLMGDGDKALQIKQVDVAGNASEISSISVTLDTSADSPILSLAENSGNPSDSITRNGRVNVAGIENGATWLYSLNGVDWLTGVGNSVDFVGDGSQSLQIKQVDLAGNESEVSSLTFTLDSDIQRPVLSLIEDSGEASDLITRNGRVNILGIENGANWQYSLDETNWLSGTGTTIDLSGDGAKSLRVKQTDLAGNTSTVANLAFTLDTTVARLIPTLSEDSGAPSDFITRNGRVNVEGLEAGANWLYSLDNINWLIGTSNFISLQGDGPKSIRVKQVDQAGNTSEVETLNFVLDTVSSDPLLSISQGNSVRTNTISGFSTPNSLVKVSVGNAVFSMTSDSNTGAWSINLFAQPNVSGNALQFVRGGSSVLVEAVVIDSAGNASASMYRPVVPHLNSTPAGSINVEPYLGGALLPENTLIANTQLVDLDGMDLQGISYRWQANGQDIAGAGSSRYYQIRESDIGKSISAIASYVDYSGTFEQVVSTATDIVKKRNSLPSGYVSIAGLSGFGQPYSVVSGQTLTAENSIADADGVGPISYQWYVDDAPITGAASNRYTPTQSISNHRISVIARYTDSLGNNESVWSGSLLINVEPSPEPAPLPPEVPDSEPPVVESTPVPDTPSPAVVTYKFPIAAIQSIGLSPDGQFLLIKIAGVTSSVLRSETLDFSNQLFSTEQLAAQIVPTPVFRSSGGSNGYTLPEVFTGPASLGLQYQLIETADNAVVIGGTSNDFIKVSSTNSLGKAVDGGGGSDVIDGGVGSTFVSGGINHFGSTFFLDGRAPGNSWSTITDFKQGSDKATIWGWKQGVSKVSTAFTDFNSGGAAGFKGLTLHFENLLPDNAAPGQVNPNLNSITLTGFTLSDFGASSISELNAQIAAGTNKYFQVGSVTDQFGDHGYLFLS